jgi:hypothetical protein
MAITSSFANLATVTRASKKTDAGGWDFVNATIVGTLTEYATNVAAIHPTQGAFIERTGSTNEIRNPRCEGAVAGTIGSGGSIPTHWTSFLQGSSTVTYTIEGSGTENGWPYVDFGYSGTANSKVAEIRFESTTQTTASNGQTWTSSVGMRLVSGDLTGVSQIRSRITTFLSGSAAQDLGSASLFSASLDSNHRRFKETGTISTACDAITTGFRVDFAASGAVDFVLRVYLPQNENLSYASSPVLPTAASPAVSTRAADQVSIANGAWENDGASTFFASLTPVQSYTGAIVSAGADNNNRITVSLSGSDELLAFVSLGGVTQWNAATTDASLALGTAFSFALGADTDDGALSVGGATQITDSAMTLPTLASGIVFGQPPGGGSLSVGFYLRDFRYWPRRLSNAELEALVGN